MQNGRGGVIAPYLPRDFYQKKHMVGAHVA
jgi:hypothetical protein